MAKSADMRTDPSALIREVIRATMEAQEISEARLALDSYINRTTLRNKLAGASEFTVAELVRVADALGVTLRDLIEPASAA
jgi:transcriptional regulator with XRE-family HTH domain